MINNSYCLDCATAFDSLESTNCPHCYSENVHTPTEKEKALYYEAV